eukprot:scaffold1054_cov366-Prasinococcus_capsulatus_cf.AAC.23
MARSSISISLSALAAGARSAVTARAGEGVEDINISAGAAPNRPVRTFPGYGVGVRGSPTVATRLTPVGAVAPPRSAGPRQQQQQHHHRMWSSTAQDARERETETETETER